MTPRERPRCSTSSPVPWRRSRLTVPTIRTAFTRRSPSMLRMPPSSCCHVRRVPSAAAETAPTQRDQHIQEIAERGRMGWQKSSGYNLRARVEASIGRYKRVIGDALRSRTDETEATEVAIAAAGLNRMLEFGRPRYIRIA